MFYDYVKYLYNSEVKSTKQSSFKGVSPPSPVSPPPPPVFFLREACNFCSNGYPNGIKFIEALWFSLFLAGGSFCCLFIPHFEQHLELAGEVLAPPLPSPPPRRPRISVKGTSLYPQHVRKHSLPLCHLPTGPRFLMVTLSLLFARVQPSPVSLVFILLCSGQMRTERSAAHSCC